MRTVSQGCSVLLHLPLLLLIVWLPSELESRAPRPPPRANSTCPPSLSTCAYRALGRSSDDSTIGGGGSCRPSPNCLGTVSVLGLFELSEGGRLRQDGRSEVEAAKLAVHHVNSRRILGNIALNLIVNDTKGDPGVGLDSFFHAIYTRQERLAILLGTANSEVTETLARVVPYWNILQISFGAMSPTLSDRSEFPYFYRTIAPDSSHNPARIAFLKRFAWETVTAFSQNEDLYSLAVNDLVTELETANITCKATITFAETEITEQLKALKELDTRIVIGSFSQIIARKVFCEAHKLGIYGGDYAWLLQGLPANGWWEDPRPCGSDLKLAAEGVILVTNYKPQTGQAASISGLSSREFEAQMEGLVSGYAHQTYDAIWAATLALVSAQKVRDIVDSPYESREFVDTLARNMASLSFYGVSGPVSFDGPDRVGMSAFHQVQGGKAVMIAVYDPHAAVLDMNCPECVAPAWPGGQVPTGKRYFLLRTETVQPMAFMGIASVATFGMCLALGFLLINLHFRRHNQDLGTRVRHPWWLTMMERIHRGKVHRKRLLKKLNIPLVVTDGCLYIKLSSPKLNNVAGVGCVLVYTAVILLGLDSSTLPSTKIFPTVCTARVYLLSAGFSMAFGSMFAKTYRVHRIFTRNARGVKNKLLQDTQLISLICVLLVVDGLIVTLWVTIDPIERQLRNLSMEVSLSDRSIVYQSQVEICSSLFIHNWLGALYVYKGLMLTVGVYMAWETRHVKIPALNDSQYIGLSVYSVVITSVLVVVLANLVSERVTLAFLCISLPILVSTTGSLCLLFVPKLYELFVHRDNPNRTDPVMQSMGLKIECNTRRFLTDDRRELYFRVEVQNRVYRRELQLLDSEILKLEKQLSFEGSSTSSVSSPPLRNDPEDILEMLPFPMPTAPRGKSPSVSSGIPVLLLSVLPPVIPRASWPSEDASQRLRPRVTFHSESKLNEKQSIFDPITPLRANNSQGNHSNKVSMFGKILNMIYPGATMRKSSAPAGFVSAFKAHVEYFASNLPSNKSASESCESSINGSKSWATVKAPYIVSDDSSNLGQGNSGSLGFGENLVSSDCEEDDEEKAIAHRRRSRRGQARSVQSLSHHHIPVVTFDPACEKQRSQPSLSSWRDRVPKGSPRFPHRISPTVSLETLQERYLTLKRQTFLNSIRQEPEGRDAEQLPLPPEQPTDSALVHDEDGNPISSCTDDTK